jgi:hypothetical protein
MQICIHIFSFADGKLSPAEMLGVSTYVEIAVKEMVSDTEVSSYIILRVNANLRRCNEIATKATRKKRSARAYLVLTQD